MNCMGARHEDQARKVLRALSRRAQKQDYPVRFRNFRIHNISAVADLGMSEEAHTFVDA